MINRSYRFASILLFTQGQPKSVFFMKLKKIQRPGVTDFHGTFTY